MRLLKIKCNDEQHLNTFSYEYDMVPTWYLYEYDLRTFFLTFTLQVNYE